MFNNLTIKTRLISLITFLSVLMIAVGVMGLWGMGQSNQGLKTVYEDRTVPLGDVNMIIRKNNLNLQAVADALLNPTPEIAKEHVAEIKKTREEIGKIWDGYMATYLTPEEAVVAKNFADARTAFVKEGLTPAEDALLAGRYADARRLYDGAMREAFKNVRKYGNDLAQLQLDIAKSEYDEAQKRFGTIRNISILLIIIGVLMGIFIATMLIRNLSRSLSQASDVATKIAAGDLTSRISITNHDEVGQLLKSMQIMQDAINAFVTAQGVMAQKHAEGWIKEQIDDTKFQGTYGKMAREINELVNSHIAVKMKVVEVISQYAKGDFARDMDRLPGDKAKITAAMDAVKQALLDISNQIKMLAEAGAQGDFGKRGEAERFEFIFRDMLRDMNTLIDTCDVGFNDVMRVAQALAKGDLTQSITKDYPGVFGQTKDAMNGTVSNLKELVGQIKDATDTINTASKEIAAGNSDLSQRTEEQASSLEETASSMEELTSTVKQNAENAKQANQLAIGASDVAGKGGAVVGQVVTTMDSINESSRKIVDIISVIDGIAFQTNILALNAAVEAARAGEQGRGFAVVAGEVRNLAQRSAAAAKEIKTLIGDSVEKVEGGSKLVAQAGQTMEEIVTAIKRVTDIMSEISAASTEQSAGIEQVNLAITQMDEVTQQNAALVEEAAAAAESLEEQAQNLSVSVGTFKVDDKGGTALAVRRETAPVARQTAPARKPAALGKPGAGKGTAAAKPRAKPQGGDDDGEWSEF